MSLLNCYLLCCQCDLPEMYSAGHYFHGSGRHCATWPQLSIALWIDIRPRNGSAPIVWPRPIARCRQSHRSIWMCSHLHLLYRCSNKMVRLRPTPVGTERSRSGETPHRMWWGHFRWSGRRMGLLIEGVLYTVDLSKCNMYELFVWFKSTWEFNYSYIIN